MKLYFLGTDVGCFEFLFTTNEMRATQLFTIYMVLAKLRPSKLWLTELTPDTVNSAHCEHLKKALLCGSEGFASYEEGVGWTIRPLQREFDQLAEDASEGGVE